MQKEIVALKERNKKVEADKAWETSWSRKLVIAVLTYAVIVIFFYLQCFNIRFFMYTGLRLMITVKNPLHQLFIRISYLILSS